MSAGPLILVIIAAIAFIVLITKKSRSGEERQHKETITRDSLNVALAAANLSTAKKNYSQAIDVQPLISRIHDDGKREFRATGHVVGTTQTNTDGSSRQKIIARLKAEDEVRLVREPENPYDANAVAVHAVDGQIGYLSREQAAEYAPLIDSGSFVRANVSIIVGGEPGKPRLGVWLDIWIPENQGVKQ